MRPQIFVFIDETGLLWKFEVRANNVKMFTFVGEKVSFLSEKVFVILENCLEGSTPGRGLAPPSPPPTSPSFWSERAGAATVSFACFYLTSSLSNPPSSLPRRGLLTIYMANLVRYALMSLKFHICVALWPWLTSSCRCQATETLFRMAAARGVVKPIKHGEVSLFTSTFQHSV